MGEKVLPLLPLLNIIIIHFLLFYSSLVEDGNSTNKYYHLQSYNLLFEGELGYICGKTLKILIRTGTAVGVWLGEYISKKSCGSELI